jgi:hypothetical protein
MSHSSNKHGRPWRLALGISLACAGLLALATPSQAAWSNYCPAGGGTITLPAETGCTNSVHTFLYSVTFINTNTPYHCAVIKAGPQADGSSSNLSIAACGYGAAGVGELTSAAPSGGVWGYARGTNGEARAFAGYRGLKEHP